MSLNLSEAELLYADDLVLMIETTEGLRARPLKCNEAFESRGLKANLRKSKVNLTDQRHHKGWLVLM